MVSKRKRDPLEGFDPNKSDSGDGNFDPTEERSPRKAVKKSRSMARGGGGAPRRRHNKYGGSDIDDDDDAMSESGQEDSFGDHDDMHGVEEDENLGTNALGVRRRKAAVNHISYKESSDESDVIEDSEPEPELEPEPPRRSAGKVKANKSPAKPSRIVILKTKNLKAASADAKGRANSRRAAKTEASLPPSSAPMTRRNTRARTEDAEDEFQFVELSNSGRHARAASGSKSPETFSASRSTRATRGAKGIKKPPETIHEATQETEVKSDVKMSTEGQMDEDVDELAGASPEAAQAEEENNNMDLDGADSVIHHREVEDSANENADEEPVEEQAENAAVDEPAEEPAADENDGDDDDDDDDDEPIAGRRTRGKRPGNPPAAPTAPEKQEEEEEEEEEDENEDEDEERDEAGGSAQEQPKHGGRRPNLRRKSTRLRGKKSTQEPSSDWEPGEESGDGEAEASNAAHREHDDAEDEDEEPDSTSTPTARRGRSTRGKGRHQPKRNTRSGHNSGEEEVELDKDEMADELEELRQDSRSRTRRTTRRRSPAIVYEPVSKRRRTAKVDYTIPALEPAVLDIEDDDPEPAATPARGGRRGGRNGASQAWERNLNTTYGPFGGGGGAGSLLGGPWGTGAAAGAESDSSGDEMPQRSGVGGAVGMTPTHGAPSLGLFVPPGQQAETPALAAGVSPGTGKKNQKAFADADPLGVDMTVEFNKVGGLDDHINKLKEMVQLPLLYPEMYAKFHITPPRGVLFHGPPGTGKTLLARALANSMGAGGRKINFFMRKGADALSKWVGEAERQLRLLFEEARRVQPSIIFFDEIDGLAPVRSSKQEQIHASIVSTLLALMDGMDGRGQVIVIGATNRPDSIDPALRRPGRFDREFYFALPDLAARKAILDIHTRDWGLSDSFKHHLALRTKGYGGADLRALCTEAAVNSMQRTFPQLWSSKEKLVIDVNHISVHATDFMLVIKKLVPSSERSASSSAMPLPQSIEPLLRKQFQSVLKQLEGMLPRKKKVTALEEAMYEPYDDADNGFGREAMHQDFERSRVFRPRLLIYGQPGMGQNYISAAVLHHFEDVHVQNFDLATLLGDGRPVEQVIVGMFTEVKRHKPSVIYIPDVETWWESMSQAAITTFVTMLKNIPATDPVLLLATSECGEIDSLPRELVAELFGFSRKNRKAIDRPDQDNRREYFQGIAAHLGRSPLDFPDPSNRKKRRLEELPVAPPPAPKTLTKAEEQAQRKTDFHCLNLLKVRLQPIMDQINRKYRKFRHPPIPLAQIEYLFHEADPNFVRPDLAENVRDRPFEIAKDKEGVDGIREMATGKFFYNLETTTIEERLANGYYARPLDFYKDINRLYLDSKALGDRDRKLKSNELRTNVEVDVHDIEQSLAHQGIRFEEIHQRQLQRTREAEEKALKAKAFQPIVDLIQSDLAGDEASDSIGPVGVASFSMMTRTVQVQRQVQAQAPAQVTGARFQFIGSPSPQSNGHVGKGDSRALTNGTIGSSRPSDGEDVQMSGLEDDSQLLHGPADHNNMGPPSQWPRLPKPQTQPDSARATIGGTQTQRSAITSLAPGVSPSAILNDASTTSTNHTRQSLNNSTPHTNGFHGAGGGFASNTFNADDSLSQQLVDTQRDGTLGSQAQGLQNTPSTDRQSQQWAHSQAMAIQQGILNPRGYASGHTSNGSGLSPMSSQAPSGGGGPASYGSARLGRAEGGMAAGPTTTTTSSRGNTNNSHAAAASLDNILNNDDTGAMLHADGSSAGSSGGLSQQQQQAVMVAEERVGEFLETLARRTSGCTIEQLEQIHRELSEEVWRTRGQWNRMTVLTQLHSVFNETIADIETMQGVQPNSQLQESQRSKLGGGISGISSRGGASLGGSGIGGGLSGGGGIGAPGASNLLRRPRRDQVPGSSQLGVDEDVDDGYR